MTTIDFTARVTDTYGRQALSPQKLGVGSVIALLHFDGANGATVFTDETGKTWTRSGATTISTAQSKYGGAAGLFGANNYISTPDHADFAIGSEDFTFEAWVYSTSWPGGTYFPCIIGQRTNNTTSNAFTFYFNSTGTELRVGMGTPTFGVAYTFLVNTWYHVAATRIGDTLRLFVNGVLQDEFDVSANTIINSSAPVRIGAFDNPVYTSSFFRGYIDDLRVVRGAGMYAADFTPPLAALPNP